MKNKTLAQVKKIIKDNDGYNVKTFYYRDGKEWVLEYYFETFKGFRKALYSSEFEDNRIYKTEQAAATQAAKLAKSLSGVNKGHLKDLDFDCPDFD